MNNVTTVYALEVASPLGMLQLVSDANYLVELNWQGAHKRVNSASKPAAAILVAAANELSQFFDGERRHFSVPVDPRGTDFQLSVWSELQNVAWGTTCTYGDIAKRLGKPTGSRAVGSAVGRNPLPIFIPCHRVVGSNGSLTGFSGGLQNKGILLGCEGHTNRPGGLMHLDRE